MCDCVVCIRKFSLPSRCRSLTHDGQKAFRNSERNFANCGSLSGSTLRGLCFITRYISPRPFGGWRRHFERNHLIRTVFVHLLFLRFYDRHQKSLLMSCCETGTTTEFRFTSDAESWWFSCRCVGHGSTAVDVSINMFFVIYYAYFRCHQRKN